MKVFGIGWHKTGTTTLALCLRSLGFNHMSCNYGALCDVVAGNLSAVFDIVDQYDSFEDWPWPLIYRELDERYPGSKFILTTRSSSQVWYRSLKRYADRTGPTTYRELIYGYAMPRGRKREHVALYEKHNDDVRNYFKGRNDFIELCWEHGHGWKELCGFLQRSIPAEAFPHANKSPSTFARAKKLSRRLARATIKTSSK